MENDTQDEIKNPDKRGGYITSELAFFFIFGLVLLFMGLQGIQGYEFNSSVNYQEVKDKYVKTEATITSSKDRTAGRNNPVITGRFIEYNYMNTSGEEFSSSTFVDAKYQTAIGMKYDIYYNPYDPENTVLADEVDEKELDDFTKNSGYLLFAGASIVIMIPLGIGYRIRSDFKTRRLEKKAAKQNE